MCSSCRDAHDSVESEGVRYVALSGRTIVSSQRESVTSPRRDARSVRPSPLNHGCCNALSTTDAQTERPYSGSFCFVDNYSSRPSASLQRDTRIIVTRQVVTRCGVVSQLLLLLRRISSMPPICVPLVTMIENLPAPSFTITKQAFTS